MSSPLVSISYLEATMTKQQLQDQQDAILDSLVESGASDSTVKEVANLFYEEPVNLSDESLTEITEIFASS